MGGFTPSLPTIPPVCAFRQSIPTSKTSLGLRRESKHMLRKYLWPREGLFSGSAISQLLRLSLWATLLAPLPILSSQSWAFTTTWHRTCWAALLIIHGLRGILGTISEGLKGTRKK